MKQKALVSFKKFELEKRKKALKKQETGLMMKGTQNESLPELSQDSILIRTGQLTDKNTEIDPFITFFRKYEKGSQFFTVNSSFFNFGIVECKSTKILPLVIENTHSSILFFTCGHLSDVFSISKTAFDIKAGDSITLALKYSPTMQNSLSSKKLTFSISSRKARKIIGSENDRLTGHGIEMEGGEVIFDDIQIDMIGSSFSAKTEPFIPIIRLLPSNKIQFRPSSISQAVFSTISLYNKSETPTLFSLNNSSDSFTIYPTLGMISPKSTVHLIARFIPHSEGIFYERVDLMLNYAFTQQIILQGYCCSDKIQVENDGNVLLPPSFPNVLTKNSFKIINLGFSEVKINLVARHSLLHPIFFPSSFLLTEGDEKIVEVELIPRSLGSYKVNCEVRVGGEEEGKEGKVIPITLMGQSINGQITMTPSVLNFGTVMVKFTEKNYLYIQNKTNSYSNIFLFIDEVDKELISLDFERGRIGPKEEKKVSVFFSPGSIISSTVRITLLSIPSTSSSSLQLLRDKSERFISTTKQLEQESLLNPEESSPYAKQAEIKRLQESLKQLSKEGFSILSSTEIILKSNRPLLRILNIRNDLSSPVLLSKNFHLNELNGYLSQLSDRDLDESSLDERSVVWDFGYVHNNQHGNRPVEVLIEFHNIGGTELKWRFQNDIRSNMITEESLNERNGSGIDREKERPPFEVLPR